MPEQPTDAELVARGMAVVVSDVYRYGRWMMMEMAVPTVSASLRMKSILTEGSLSPWYADYSAFLRRVSDAR